MSRGLVLDCARLAAGVVDRIEMRCAAVIEDAGAHGARVLHDTVELDLVVRAVRRGFMAAGRLDGVWAAECRRCLEEVTEPFEASLREIFEWTPVEGETWPIDNQYIDLAPAAREAAMLALPLTALCSQDCAGPVPKRFPTGPAAAQGSA